MKGKKGQPRLLSFPVGPLDPLVSAITAVSLRKVMIFLETPSCYRLLVKQCSTSAAHLLSLFLSRNDDSWTHTHKFLLSN